MSEKHVREALKRSDVVLYGVGDVNTSASSPFMRQYVAPQAEVLNDCAGYSGGRAYFSLHFAKSAAFIEVFESIAVELRNQYQIVINAEQSAGKEKWRKLNVTVAQTTHQAVLKS